MVDDQVFQVEIETEWNLEVHVCVAEMLHDRVEIETEWNLEVKNSEQIRPSFPRRDRNRVEFRGAEAAGITPCGMCRDRNRVEFRVICICF